MRIPRVTILALAGVTATPLVARGQFLPPTIPSTSWVAPSPSAPAPGSSAARTALTVLGAALGAAAGVMAGGVTGAAIAGSGECPEFCSLGGFLLGGLIGGTLGAGVGAHLGGGGRGTVLAPLGASTAVLLGAFLAAGVGDTMGEAVIPVPLLQILAAALAQSLSSKGR